MFVLHALSLMNIPRRYNNIRFFESDFLAKKQAKMAFSGPFEGSIIF